MSLINCPECRKPVSEAANACPRCGFTFTPDLVAAQKVKMEKAQQAGGLIALGLFVFMLLICSGVFTSSSSSSSSPAPKPVVKSTYASDEARGIELLQKDQLSPKEIRECLLIDGRQAVRKGYMSKSAFEQYTGEEFPDD